MSLILNGVLLSKYIPEHKQLKCNEIQKDSLINRLVEEKLAQWDKKYDDLVNQLNQKIDKQEDTKEILAEAQKESDLRKEVDGMIKDIEVIQKMKPGPEMNAAVERVQKRFAAFEKKIPAEIAKEERAKVNEWLSNDIMKQNVETAHKSSTKHRKAIIDKLQSIRVQI